MKNTVVLMVDFLPLRSRSALVVCSVMMALGLVNTSASPLSMMLRLVSGGPGPTGGGRIFLFLCLVCYLTSVLWRAVFPPLFSPYAVPLV